MNHSLVYGPVASRRLGLSLGIDPVAHKVCSYDCLYCQVGRTTERSIERRAFFPVRAILAEVEEVLQTGPVPDVLTIAGSGEPTLYVELDRLILGLRRLAQLPVVLITNGSLLWQPEVAEQALLADVLVPSLDAGDAETFARLNLPAPGIDFELMLGGLRRITAQHPDVRLEVMLCAGINDSPASLAALARQVAELQPTTVEINSPIRPVAARGIAPCSPAVLQEACRLFGPRAHLIGQYAGRQAPPGRRRPLSQLLALLRRHPCTRADLEQSLGWPPDELGELLAQALTEGRIRQAACPDGECFLPAPEEPG